MGCAREEHHRGGAVVQPGLVLAGAATELRRVGNQDPVRQPLGHDLGEERVQRGVACEPGVGIEPTTSALQERQDVGTGVLR